MGIGFGEAGLKSSGPWTSSTTLLRQAPLQEPGCTVLPTVQILRETLIYYTRDKAIKKTMPLQGTPAEIVTAVSSVSDSGGPPRKGFEGLKT